MVKINFISYGNKNYTAAKQRIKKEAIETNWFNNVKIYGEEDLTEEFKKKFHNVLIQKRGGGYWIWKLDIINQELSDMSNNDILIYCDAGCFINKNGEKRFREYIEMLNNSEECIISFLQKNKEKQWTIKEIFNYFELDINSKEANSGQYIGGILIMKKSEKLKLILKEYLKVLEYDMHLFTDKYNKNQINMFRENRHDQSVFSIIRKIYGSIIIPDETHKKYYGGDYPFTALRKRK